ncbi:hypothetical protein BGX33_000046 [Mortierella sp. NVP41]|nr:hypothetical protein BGX33_000046 [Mortierella sp. NVP41]
MVFVSSATFCTETKRTLEAHNSSESDVHDGPTKRIATLSSSEDEIDTLDSDDAISTDDDDSTDTASITTGSTKDSDSDRVERTQDLHQQKTCIRDIFL